MFVNQRAFGDFKDNVTSLAPGEASTHNSKELKSHSLNSFDSSTNVCHSKKTDFGLKNVDEKKVLKDKENLQPLKPKVKVPDIKIESCSDDPWSDIEDILIPSDSEGSNYLFSDDPWSDIEDILIPSDSEDMYDPDGDILPKCEQIQKKDIDRELLKYTTPEFIEETMNILSSVFKDNQNIYKPDFYIPDYSQLIGFPDKSLLLYDDTELVPLPNI